MTTAITIYQYNTVVVRAVVDPDDKSTQDRGIMRGDTVNLNFTSPNEIYFGVGDYCTIYGTEYRINRDVQYDKIADRNFSYNITLEGPYHKLSRVQYLTFNAFNQLAEGKFTLRGTPADFVDLVVRNMNERFPHDEWEAGFVLPGDYMDIDFDGENCLQVMSKLATNYKTEFLIDGNKISLIKTQVATGVTLEYGKGQALLSLGRQNQDNNTNRITRLYAYGSDKNLGSNYRNGAPRLRMADSLYIERNANAYGVYEATVVFDGTNGNPEIYPHRTGTISSVTDIHTFADDSIGFDLNDPAIEMPGVPAKITFNTGLLTGETFSIASFDAATKTFVINPNTDSQTNPLPTADFKPAIGDQYVITDIIMPVSYLNDAEAALKTAAEQYLAQNGATKVSYTPGCNPLWFKSTGTELELGKSYRLFSTIPAIDLQLRVMGYSRNLRKKFVYTNLVLADTVVPQLPIVKIFNSLKNAK